MSPSRQRARKRGRDRNDPPQPPRRDEVWELLLITPELPSREIEVPSALLVHVLGEGLRAIAPVERADREADLLRAVEHVIRDPEPPLEPGRPTRVVGDDPALLRALREPMLRLGVPVQRVRRLEARDTLGDLLEEVRTGFAATLLTGAVAHDERLCAAAAALARLRPWERLDELELLLVESENVAITHPVAVVIGAAGEAPGLVLYRAIEAIATQIDAAEDLDDLDDDDLAMMAPMDTLGVLYYDQDELPGEFVRAFDTRGLAVADERYPRFVRNRLRELGSDVVNPAECESLAVTLEALAAFLDQHLDALDGAYPPMAGLYELPDGARVEVRTAPRLRDYFLGEVGDAALEDTLEALPPLLDRPFLAALVLLDPAVLAARLPELADLSSEHPALVLQMHKRSAHGLAHHIEAIDAVTLLPIADRLWIIAVIDQAPVAIIAALDASDPQMQEAFAQFEEAVARHDALALILTGGGTRQPVSSIDPGKIVHLRRLTVLDADALDV